MTLVIASALAGWTAPASAAFGIAPGSFSTVSDSSQAGAHADLTTTFAFNTHPDSSAPFFGQAPDEDAKTVVVNLPPGVVGNPQAYPQCLAGFLLAHLYCPWDTQVGVARYTLAGPAVLANIMAPIYNMKPGSGRVAEFAFMNNAFVTAPVSFSASVRSDGDYGITATVPALPGNLKPLSSSVTLWGVPADDSHDGMRGSAVGGGCLKDTFPYGPTGGTCRSGVDPKAFLSNPTDCEAAGVSSITADSWQHPGAFVAPSQSTPQRMSGCDRLAFDPSLTLQPQSRRSGVPTSYTVQLKTPQTTTPTALATPALKSIIVSLPEGVLVSASAADGLEGCSDAQVGLHTLAEAACPDGSKIGTVDVFTPLLSGPISGALYQGTQTPDQLLRLFLVAEGFGVTIKLKGSITPDPVTGQIDAVFDNNPQLPFERLLLRFKGGPRAPLSNPRRCGEKTTASTLVSWGGQTVHTTDAFVVSKDGNGAPCPPDQFTPDFSAGVENTAAGTNSSFSLYLARGDDDDEFRTVSVSLPPGLLARIADVPLCRAFQASAGTCEEVSRVGTVATSAGAGPLPLSLGGKAYITGPYNGHPFGMSIVVPAKAGPLDLGNVVVRASIEVRKNGSIRVNADPLPSILQGIPLQVRSVNVAVDRDKFIVNPTNCNPMTARGQVGSVSGLVANVSSYFQVGECEQLPFKPRLSISVGRKGHTRPGSSTPLTATLTQTPGQAGVKVATVVLPLTLNALLPVVTNACTLAEYQTGKCEKARAGSATAITPLLKDPLKGSVYFVKDPKAKKGSLPNLMVALRGQVDIDLTGKITIPSSGQLGTSFNTVPDVPITKFKLSLVDGTHGPVGIVDNLCSKKAKRARAQIDIRGQNGKTVHTTPHLKIRGCTKPRKAR